MKYGKAMFYILLIAAGLSAYPRPVNELNANLLEAVKQGDAEAVESLLKTRADVETEDEHGQTLLMVAAGSGNAEIVKLLLDAGADVNAIDERGNSALLNATATPSIRRPAMTEIVRLLIDAGADVNATNKNEQTPLLSVFWVDDGAKEVMEMLVKAGADVYVEGYWGLIPAEKPEIRKMMIDAGRGDELKQEE